MVVTLGANDVTLKRGMENWILGVLCLALFAVPQYFSPGGRVGEGELGRGDANHRTISRMQGGDMFVRSPLGYHPGIVEVASSRQLRAWVAAEWVQEDVVERS